ASCTRSPARSTSGRSPCSRWPTRSAPSHVWSGRQTPAARCGRCTMHSSWPRERKRKAAAPVAAVAFYAAAEFGRIDSGRRVGCLGGYYLDQRLGTSPWLVLALGTLGIVAGFRELIRALNRVNADEERNARGQAPPRGGAGDESERGEPGGEKPG